MVLPSNLRTPSSRSNIALELLAINDPRNFASVSRRIPTIDFLKTFSAILDAIRLICNCPSIAALALSLKNEMPARLILSPKRTSFVCCAWALLVQPADPDIPMSKTRNVANTFYRNIFIGKNFNKTSTSISDLSFLVPFPSQTSRSKTYTHLFLLPRGVGNPSRWITCLAFRPPSMTMIVYLW
jgi:hypothetical protein